MRGAVTTGKAIHSRPTGLGRDYLISATAKLKRARAKERRRVVTNQDAIERRAVSLVALQRAEHIAWLAYQRAMESALDIPLRSPRLEIARHQVTNAKDVLAAALRDLDAAMEAE